MGKMFLDPEEIEKAVNVLGLSLFEIRVLDSFKTLSGYFDNAKTMISQLEKLDLNGRSVYFTPQVLHEGCSARIQWNHFVDVSRGRIPTTSDNDVTAYRYLLVDLDPVRPSGISSSDEELKYAEEIREEVLMFLEAQDLKQNIVSLSGNGYHILSRIDLPNTKENVDEVKAMLYRLGELFSTDHCHVDTGNYNPGRIFKMPGTLAQKGRSTEMRPHRMAKILEVRNGES